jgi:transposase
MMNTHPSSPGIRRRGAQPSNRNALRYGIFAKKSPTPLTQLVNLVPLAKPGLDGIQARLDQAIPAIRDQIAWLLGSSPEGANLRSVLAWHRPIIRLLGLFIRAKKALARIQQPQLQMKFVAAHALALIRYDFRENGITCDAYSFCEKNNLSDFNSAGFRENEFTRAAYSFREKIELSDLNSLGFSEDAFPPFSDSHHPFLAPAQWAVLEPLIPPSNHLPPSTSCSPLPMCTSSGEGSGVRLGRGRPPADPRPLLDAIFWKIAHHARWQDLPAGSPPMLSCRRYYRRLFLSGRLLTLYIALFQDLHTRGQIHFSNLVDQGCLTITGNALALSPGLPDTWQLRTTLLFMQQAWQVSRRIMREKEQVQRRSLPNFR